MVADSSDYQQIFLRDVPLLDVRAPVEFAKGAFPGSINLPLLDDDQRAVIGACYKESGQDAAIALGWSLLTPTLKQARQQQWRDFIEANPGGYLYCFRGGLRSQITQQLIVETGCVYPRIVGGYKAMRQYLLDTLAALSASTSYLVISGRTCSGKTRILNNLSNGLDLEGLARHRGSAFGRLQCEQPSQIDFENALAICLLKHNYLSGAPLFVEDEGKLIGRCALPNTLRQTLRTSPRVIVHMPLRERIQIALQDYIIDNLRTFQNQFGEERGVTVFGEQILSDLCRIKKRLGGERFSAIRSLLHDAVDYLHQRHSVQGFVPAIHALLVDYYDPMYDYQRQQGSSAIAFEGSCAAVQEWCKQYQYQQSRGELAVEAL
jgi:tRNA 2-selenouridine synthase